MKRRSFLGFMGGAVAAGPTLASGIAESVSPAPPIGSLRIGVERGEEADIGSWRAKRIRELQQIIKGGDPIAKHDERMKRLYAAETAERFRLDALRSVSPTQKHRMLIDGAEERGRRIRQTDAEWSLAQLLSGN